MYWSLSSTWQSLTLSALESCQLPCPKAGQSTITTTSIPIRKTSLILCNWAVKSRFRPGASRTLTHCFPPSFLPWKGTSWFHELCAITRYSQELKDPDFNRNHYQLFQIITKRRVIIALVVSWALPLIISLVKALTKPFEAFSLSLPCLSCVSGYTSQTIITVGKGRNKHNFDDP